MSPSDPDFWNFRRRSVELFVNYLLMGQGAVLGRAVSTLRSVEAHPSTLNSFGTFVFFFPPPFCRRGLSGKERAQGLSPPATRFVWQEDGVTVSLAVDSLL